VRERGRKCSEEEKEEKINILCVCVYVCVCEREREKEREREYLSLASGCQPSAYDGLGAIDKDDVVSTKRGRELTLIELHLLPLFG
jgi:hypothetical protein